MRRASLRALLVVPLLALAPACTDLTETSGDALTPDNAFKTQAEIDAGVASVYASLRGTMWGYYNLSEITTDEMVVPTRGTDWYDAGRWLEIHRHTWTPGSGSANDDMNGTWNDLYAGVSRANLMISILNNRPESPANTRTLAELRTLRAWYYFGLMDFFGNVPLVLTTNVVREPNVSRDSIFRFIESELRAVRLDLPVQYEAFDASSRPNYGRVTRGAADAILATLYLNAHIFNGTFSGTTFTPGTPRWQDAANFADSVINSAAQYRLAPIWRDNFSTTNENSRENIFVIVHVNVDGLGNSLPMRTLHYDQLAPSPWNGFATLAETYRSFDDTDYRKQMFLIGPQTSFNTGQPVPFQGRTLTFTDTLGNTDATSQETGARFNKYPPLAGAPGGNAHPNDFVIFRLAEMYLIKAEALNELGQSGAAINLINTTIRARSGQDLPDLVAAGSQAGVRAQILNERLFEFAAEAKRRRDLIRMDRPRFLAARPETKKLVSEEYRILFPIPNLQIQTNTALVQNPGYN